MGRTEGRQKQHVAHVPSVTVVAAFVFVSRVGSVLCFVRIVLGAPPSFTVWRGGPPAHHKTFCFHSCQTVISSIVSKNPYIMKGL